MSKRIRYYRLFVAWRGDFSQTRNIKSLWRRQIKVNGISGFPESLWNGVKSHQRIRDRSHTEIMVRSHLDLRVPRLTQNSGLPRSMGYRSRTVISIHRMTRKIGRRVTRNSEVQESLWTLCSGVTCGHVVTWNPVLPESPGNPTCRSHLKLRKAAVNWISGVLQSPKTQGCRSQTEIWGALVNRNSGMPESSGTSECSNKSECWDAEDTWKSAVPKST